MKASLHIAGVTTKAAEVITEVRPLCYIAREVLRLWTSPANYAAKPYLQALCSMKSITDTYGHDTGKDCVIYALGNMAAFRGPEARRLKSEFRAHLK